MNLWLVDAAEAFCIDLYIDSKPIESTSIRFAVVARSIPLSTSNKDLLELDFSGIS